MFDAQYLPQGTTVYSPWFPRQGDSVTCTLDIVAISGSTNLTVELYTKNSEDEGPGENADDTISITGNSAGQATPKTWVGVSGTGAKGPKELVRYKFSSASGSGWYLFRMLDPVWFDDVKA